MAGMSDIRKAIMARLGFAAGEKAEMGFVGTAGHAGSMAARGMQDGAAAYRAGKPAVLNRLDPKYQGWSDKDLDVYGNFWMRGWTGEQIKNMTSRDKNRGIDIPGFRASRPGAKEAFAADAGAVAKEILRQLGGGRFMSMVGGKNAFHGNFGGKPGLQVDIGKGAEGGINRVIVTLDPATDTYNMEFWRIAKGGLSTKKVSEAHGVYADDLQRVFTDRTKFYTSMSRPGAKEEMARWETERTKRWNKPIVEHTAKIRGNSFRIEAAEGSSSGTLYLWNDMRGFERIQNGSIDSLKQMAEQMGAKEARGVAAIERRANYARPGAKSTHAADGFYGDSEADAVQHMAAQDKTCAECEAETVKEGDKWLMATDPAVGKKIGKLMDEGYPQKQAIAIALDMKRRGEI